MRGPVAQFWSERTPDKREVIGSIPIRPTNELCLRVYLCLSWRRLSKKNATRLLENCIEREDKEALRKSGGHSLRGERSMLMSNYEAC